MKSREIQFLHVLIAAVILAASVAPACAGGENCSMPCCRHKPQPVSHQTDPAHSKPCCTPTADASSGIGSGCRFNANHLALNSEDRTPAALAPALLAAAADNTSLGPACRAPRRVDSARSDKAPLYLRIQTLLI
jgi:hypothetical protein